LGLFFRLHFFLYWLFWHPRCLKLRASLQLKNRAGRGMPCLSSAAFSYAESFPA
jgi:hypothetical protein